MVKCDIGAILVMQIRVNLCNLPDRNMKNAGNLHSTTVLCRSRCSYCDFATGMYDAALAERYVKSVAKEITSWHEVESVETADTIYFGGGHAFAALAGAVGNALERCRKNALRFQATRDSLKSQWK